MRAMRAELPRDTSPVVLPLGRDEYEGPAAAKFPELAIRGDTPVGPLAGRRQPPIGETRNITVGLLSCVTCCSVVTKAMHQPSVACTGNFLFVCLKF